MKPTHLLLAAAVGLTLGVAHAATRPNVLFILADDLGYGDTGPTFQDARAAKHDPAFPAFATPGLDALAHEGMQLRNHYSAAPVCAPSRASLVLGVNQGHSNVRDNQFDKGIADNHTLATVLRTAGYATAAIGKWGLQGDPMDIPPGGPKMEGKDLITGRPSNWAAYPTKRGFDFYFGYIRHVDGHFHYPKEDHRQVWENDREVSAGLDGCYTTDLFTARAKKWIEDHEATHREQPFFLYLAYDTPHAKLQYPPCAYPQGGGLHGGVQWTGQPGAMLNTAHGKVDGWCDPAVATATWDDDHNPATPEVPWPDVQKRHASDVRRIDAAVADVMQLLKDLEIDGDTLVVFTSDNGPAQESYLAHEPYNPNFFDGFGPFDGIKRDTWEGGIREPTFVRWPGHVPADRIVRTPSGMWDWLATFADVAGLPPPAESDGVSLLPTLTGHGVQRPTPIYLEYYHDGKTPGYRQFAPAHRNRMRGQMQVIMDGPYTGVRYNIKSEADDFEIYDVELDPQETHNLAHERGFNVVQARMKARALGMRLPNISAPRPYDSTPVPAETPAHLRPGRIETRVFDGSWPWVPDFATLAPTATGEAAAIDAAACPARDHTGVAFEGYFHAPATGDYTFSVADDAGAELLVHEAHVVDDDYTHNGGPVSGTIRLAAGWHPIRLYYRHVLGAAKLEVTCSGPGLPKGPIPAAALAIGAE